MPLLQTMRKEIERITRNDKAEFIKYGIAGVIAVLVDLGINYLLHPIFHYLLASIIAFVCSFLTSFCLQKFWTFRNHSLEKIRSQSSISFAVATGNLFLNTLLMYLFVSVFGMHYLFARVFVVIPIALESYLINKYVVFHRHT